MIFILFKETGHSVEGSCLSSLRQPDLFDDLFDISLAQLSDVFYEQIAASVCDPFWITLLMLLYLLSL